MAETASALSEIAAERNSQDEKWGEQNHGDLYWLGILIEEVGEAAKNIIEHKPAELTRTELIQCAAVVVAWIECVDRRGE